MSFLDYLKKNSNKKFTEKGAVAYSTTDNALLDFFGSAAAMRARPDADLVYLYARAWEEDRALALKALFWLRDIRGGAGERRAFRVLLHHLARANEPALKANMANIAEYGRYDDYLALLDTPMESELLAYLSEQIKADLEAESPSLLAKWLPSENASSPESRDAARKLIRGWGMTSKQYRQMLSKLRSRIVLVESLMSQQRWEELNYEHVPSYANLRYRTAFFKHDEERYIEYLQAVAVNKAKMNAGTLFPYDIVHRCFEDRYPAMAQVLDLLWKGLPDYLEGRNESGICVVDVSGSMFGRPLEVAISLGIYCAERAQGPFRDHFITFSARPHLQKIIGATITAKVNNLYDAAWDMNTDLEAVFRLILATALEHNVPQDQLPSKLYIISDMEFDQALPQASSMINKSLTLGASGPTFMESMRNLYRGAGYELPQLVFWNVEARQNTFHMMEGEEGFCLVSGCSPSLFRSVLLGEELAEQEREEGEKAVLDPMQIMLATLNAERYDKVVVD